LDELQAWLRNKDQAPGWSKVLLAEARQVTWPTEPNDRSGKLSRASLRTLAEFEPRWNELVIACRGSWIDLSAYGVLGDSLVVLVRWDISQHLLIDGPASEETRLDHIKDPTD